MWKRIRLVQSRTRARPIRLRFLRWMIPLRVSFRRWKGDLTPLRLN